MNRWLTEFSPPELLQTDQIIIRPLSVHDVVKDYDAVMTSIPYLQKTQPFGPDHDWPTAELTFEQDLIDLGWHQKEFQRKSSFAYTVLSPDETVCLGCLYIYPSPNAVYDAEIIMWVRASEAESGLDEHLFMTVENWIAEKWPFQNPGYPGRKITWKEWASLK